MRYPWLKNKLLLIKVIIMIYHVNLIITLLMLLIVFNNCRTTQKAQPKAAYFVHSEFDTYLLYKKEGLVYIKICGLVGTINKQSPSLELLEIEKDNCARSPRNTVSMPAADFNALLKNIIYMPFAETSRFLDLPIDRYKEESLSKGFSNEQVYKYGMEIAALLNEKKFIKQDLDQYKKFLRQYELYSMRTSPINRQYMSRAYTIVEERLRKFDSNLVDYIRKANERIDQFMYELSAESTYYYSIPLPTQPVAFIYLVLRRFFINYQSLKPISQFVSIPAGSFLMGSDEYGDNVKPAHTVTLPQFSISKSWVTKRQWVDTMLSIPWFKQYYTDGNLDLDPAISITWVMARNFAATLNNCPLIDANTLDSTFQDKCTTKRIKSGLITYRLPTEAEWEYTAQRDYINQKQGITKDTNIFPITEDFTRLKRGHSIPMGEWVEDKWHPNYTGAPNNGQAWDTNNSEHTVRHFSHCKTEDNNCFLYSRYSSKPNKTLDQSSFRLVKVNINTIVKQKKVPCCSI